MNVVVYPPRDYAEDRDAQLQEEISNLLGEVSLSAYRRVALTMFASSGAGTLLLLYGYGAPYWFIAQVFGASISAGLVLMKLIAVREKIERR